jgi:hypothetical protein
MRSLIAAVLSAALLSPCVAPAQGSPPTTPAQGAPAQGAPAQGAPAQATPAQAREERDSLEPAVDTSATPPPAQPSTPGGQQAPAGAKTEAPSGDGSAAAGAQPKTSSGKAMDHLELGTTDITGNRELPKVLYIVPWKTSDLGDLTGKPLNSLVDETLQPIDRDVFKRENRYYGAVAQKASPGGKSGAGSAAGTDRNGSPAQRSGAGDER